MRLYGSWRSSAAHRVRIALHWKGVAFEPVAVDLRRGEHRTLTALHRNPQGLVPLIETDDGRRLGQSLAIIELLEEAVPEPPLLPRDPWERARVRALALLVACDAQPLAALRVRHHVRRAHGQDEHGAHVWARHWLAQGLAALEAELARGGPGRYAHGDRVSLADVLLVPQVHEARRFGCALEPYPAVLRVERACLELPAFDRARPERQGDAA